MSPATTAQTLTRLLAHGFLASGDTWAAHAKRFSSNGHCPERYVSFDWDCLNRAADHASALDLYIDTVRAAHGVEQVDLMGHSAGGGLGYDYLAAPERAAKVARYVHVASFAKEAPAGPEGAPVATLNIWSPDDTVVDAADIQGAENVVFSAGQAVLNGCDTFTLDGEDVAAPELASSEDTLIALFAYDDGADGQDGEVGVFAGVPFLNGLDRYIAADPAASLTVTLNERTLVAPRWPSEADGAVIFVFD